MLAAVELVCEAQDRDGERHVGLYGGDDLSGRGFALLEQTHDAVTGLDQHREGLERLEGGGQPATVALVVTTLLTSDDGICS
jgi:hypothetical protein